MTKKVKFKKKRSHSNHLTALRGKNPLWKIPRIRLQFLVTILLSFMLAVGGFSLTWHMMPCAWKIARHIPGMDLDRETLKTELTERAKNYDLPSSEKNKQEQATFKPFFDCLDSYTGIAIYSGSKHYFRTQHTADIVHSKNWNFFTNMIFQITYSNYASVLPLNGIEDYFQIEVEFKNETGELYVSSFHNSKLTIPWFLFSIGVALFLLLLLPLLFLRKKVQDIGILKDHILQMSGGDLNQPIASMGNDEFGVLARELDQMRSTLYTNIQQEVESRRANQDLITAMSHDLRTPLTILHGYLDFLRLAGFQTSETIAPLYGQIEGDETSLKRLFQNLFSNVLKYGDKSEPVTLQISQKNDIFQIILSNAVKKDLTGIESNRIGLKSAEKIAKMHHGTLTFTQKDKTLFLVEVTFPLP